MNRVYHVLVVGSGSVGKRHAGNLAALGCTISCVDPRQDRREELGTRTPLTGSYATLEEALAQESFDGIAICSPPSVHVPQAELALAARIAVLLEKPVCPNLPDACRLASLQKQAGTPLLLGYTWRWWPPLRRVRQLIEQKVVGSLRHVRFTMSAHLADWHPWERYQDFFMAKRQMGGGALLDESHWIDQACWLFGEPQEVFAKIEKLSDLEIETDDNVDLLLTYQGSLRVCLHLDLYGRPHEKSTIFAGEGGTIRWSSEPSQIAIGQGMAGWDRIEPFTCERNEMFIAVAREFLQVMQGSPASCTLADGVAVLRIIEAARRSSSEGRIVRMSEVER